MAKRKKKVDFVQKKEKVNPIITQSRMGCLVMPYKSKQSRMLEANTGSYDPVYHKMEQYVGFIIPYDGCMCYVTYCRDYNFLRRALPDYPVEKAKFGNMRRMCKQLNLVGVTSFKPAQTELIAQIDNSMRTKGERLWFIHLQTSGGKTLLATYYATVFNTKTLILCFSDNILRQWEETFLTKTDIDPSRIVRLHSGIMRSITCGRIGPDRYDVYLATPRLMDMYANENSDYLSLKRFYDAAGIGFLIYDEAHRHVSSIVRLSSVTNPKYQMYLSADFGQGDYDKDIQFKNIFRNTPILEPSDQLRRTMKYTKVIAFKFNTYPTTLEKEAIFNKYGYSPELYMRYEFSKGIVQRSILHIIKTFLNNALGQRMLILFNNIEHVEAIYELVKKVFPQYKVGRFYGDVNIDEKDEVKNEADIIVATYGSFSTGLDTENIKYVVSCNQCNKVQDNQSAGRSRPMADGSDALYFMLVDIGFAYCRAKLQKRLEYLQETKARDDLSYNYVFNEAMHIGEFPDIDAALANMNTKKDDEE